MFVLEFNAKALFNQFNIPTPPGFLIKSLDDIPLSLPFTLPAVVKAQISSGARGKAGGVIFVNSIDQLKTAVNNLLGKPLVTNQTSNTGKIINSLLVEKAAIISHEFYLSITIDRQTATPVLLASIDGGVNIESVAMLSPEKIVKEYIDPAVGLLPFQATRVAYNLNLPPAAIRKATNLMLNLYNLFISKDCSIAEINPLALTNDNDIIALDAKLNFDDSALYRHPDIEKLRNEDEEDPKERRAAKADLNYVNLGGNVACMVNGAGLAMATVDILKHYGGEPANFLDVGGDSTPEKIAEAFQIMLDGGQAKGIFVNIFGGINKCDLVAEGIIEAAKIISSDGKSLPVPVVVRLEGTNVERGRQILNDSPISNVIMAPNMEDGAREIVRLVKEAS